VLLKKEAIKGYFIFPSHLTNASALPGERYLPPRVGHKHLPTKIACIWSTCILD